MIAPLLALALAASPARALEAAAGKVDITPDLRTERVWLAGFGAKGREPSGVHDPLYARLLVLREGKTTVAIAAFDLLGLYLNGTESLRRAWAGGEPGRILIVHATHQHSGPDTLGLWGRFPGVSGINRAYEDRIMGRVVQELRLLETSLKPATMTGGKGVLNPLGLCRDSRDPQVIDPNLATLRVRGKDGKSIATVVNWSCHPEVIGRENHLITADYPGPLCARIEEKTGGQCVFLNGAIGGLMTPDTDKETFDEAARIGSAVADAALALPAKESGGGLSYRFLRPLVPVENSRYLLFLGALTGGHDLKRSDGAPIPAWTAPFRSLRHLLFGTKDAQRPWVETEVGVLDAGPARLLTMPAEIFPEMAIGGYDGKYAFGRPVVDAKGPERDLANAPKGPYLRDLIKAPVPMLVGLGNDELGYLVPEYDFKVRTSKSLLPRWPGHYEETNSIGRSATKILTGAAAKLLEQKR